MNLELRDYVNKANEKLEKYMIYRAGDGHQLPNGEITKATYDLQMHWMLWNEIISKDGGSYTIDDYTNCCEYFRRLRKICSNVLNLLNNDDLHEYVINELHKNKDKLKSNSLLSAELTNLEARYKQLLIDAANNDNLKKIYE